jgi:hypothetical protein
MSQAKPTGKDVEEATEPLPREAPLEAKQARLRNALELTDLLEGIAISDLPEPGSALRLTTAAALKSVIGFLASIDVSAPSLGRLMKRLSELDEGHVHPIFEAPKIPHRKPDSFSTQSLKAMAAAAVHLYLEENGVSKDQAASKVAEALHKTPFRVYGGNPIGPVMIASWRDRYIGTYGEADADAAETFQTALKVARQKYQTPAKQAAAVIAAIAITAAKI